MIQTEVFHNQWFDRKKKKCIRLFNKELAILEGKKGRDLRAKLGTKRNRQLWGNTTMAAPPRGRRPAHCGGGARPPRPRGKVRDHCSSSEPRRRRRKLFSNFLFSPFRQSSAIRGAKLVLQCSQWPKLCLHFFSMQPTPAADAAPLCPSYGPGVAS